MMRGNVVGIALLVLALLSTGAVAQSTSESGHVERTVIILAQQLAKAPDNRTLRFRYARAAYQSGRYDSAKYHLKVLMRTSENSAELDQLRRAYASVVNKSPWSFSLNFSLLPSTNIRKTSFNEIFETQLGDFTIIGGGEQESGLGARFGASVSYASVLDNGLFLNFGLDINRNWYPVERLNRYDGQASVTFGWQWVNGLTQATPYVARSIYQADKTKNSTRYGVRLSHEYYLSNDASITGSVLTETRDYDDLDYLDGPFFLASLSYRNKFADAFSLSLRGSLSHHQPQQAHLQYTGASVWGEVSRTFSDFATIGLNANVGGRQYDGIFPALTEARQDTEFGVGVSFSSPRLKILDVTPKVSCRYTKSSSNVALYEYKSTDCSVSFEQRF